MVNINQEYNMLIFVLCYTAHLLGNQNNLDRTGHYNNCLIFLKKCLVNRLLARIVPPRVEVEFIAEFNM